jgi:hypothetical protein
VSLGVRLLFVGRESQNRKPRVARCSPRARDRVGPGVAGPHQRLCCPCAYSVSVPHRPQPSAVALQSLRNCAHPSRQFRIVGLPAEDFAALPRFEKVPFYATFLAAPFRMSGG